MFYAESFQHIWGFYRILSGFYTYLQTLLLSAVNLIYYTAKHKICFCLIVCFFLTFSVSTVATNVTDKPIPLSLRLDDPKDVVVAKKQPATFHCKTHTNSTQLHYKWYFNNSLIGSDDARRKQLDNGTLYIPKVTGKRFEGYYRCLASNKFGSLLSNTATLKIAGMCMLMQLCVCKQARVSALDDGTSN